MPSRCIGVLTGAARKIATRRRELTQRMESIEFTNAVLLVGSLLILAGIFSSLIASRFGTPLLLVFLVIGMLAGEDGPGGIFFSDYQAAYLIGSLALAVILFDGGLRTKLSFFRGVLAPSLVLATIGVIITAAITGGIAAYLFGIGWVEGLLIGAIVASTDAAAVFFLLGAGGLRLQRRVQTMLHIESGTNDPMAVFMTIALVEILAAGGTFTWASLVLFGQQLVLGASLGVASGLAMSWVVNRVGLPAGLHAPFVITAAIATYGLTALLGGSGLLGVYLAGLVLGNRPLRAFATITTFHDAATWMVQIVMFVMLGLLVTPSRLLEYAVPALIVAVALILVSRPIAVALCLLPFRFGRRQIAFIAWVGLRGAVGIFLASIPMLSGLPNAELYFNVAFFVVLVSLIVQGWTIAPVAKALRVALPQRHVDVRRVELDLPGQLEYEIVGYSIEPDAPFLASRKLPTWARPLLLVRANQILPPPSIDEVRSGDYLYVLAPPWRVYLLDPLFRRHAAEERVPLPEAEFVFPGTVRMGTLGELYGLNIPTEQADQTIAEHFASTMSERPVVGDRIQGDGFSLVVRRMLDEDVERVGVQFGDAEQAAAKPPSAWRRLYAAFAELLHYK